MNTITITLAAIIAEVVAIGAMIAFLCLQNRTIEKLNRKLRTWQSVAHGSAWYEIEGGRDGSCRVVRRSLSLLDRWYYIYSIDIKIFADADKDLNRLEAEELVEKLNEL